MVAAVGSEAVIAGGGELYAQAMDRTDRIYLTTVLRAVEGDVYFPEIPEGRFRCVSVRDVDAAIPYRFAMYERVT